MAKADKSKTENLINFMGQIKCLLKRSENDWIERFTEFFKTHKYLSDHQYNCLVSIYLQAVRRGDVNVLP